MQGSGRLFELLSSEGTTQGCPLAMAMYALALVPLVKEAQKQCKQGWFADDATGCDKLGAAVGSSAFKSVFVENKVRVWVQQVKELAEVAATEPHAAFAVFTHCLQARWTFLDAKPVLTLPATRRCYSPCISLFTSEA